MQKLICFSILEFFGELTDPRQLGKVIYPLREIVLVALCAAICGADSFVEMAAFGIAKLNFLKTILPFKNGIPSHDTFRAVFANLDARQFNQIFIRWVNSLQKAIPKHVAIDGKTVRRSKNGAIPPIHVVSGWSSDQHLVVGQIKTKEKSNEITAIPELLSMLSLKGAIITIDAMGCQKDIAELIIKKKADYLLAVKLNQKTLFEEIDLIFSAAESGTAPIDIQEFNTEDRGHGRLETRIYKIINDHKLLEEMEDWPGLATIGKVTRICEINSEKTEESRYFICSRALKIKDFAATVRNHWAIENSLHWVLDIVFRDDECRTREKNAAANFVTLKHITLNMLKSLQVKHSMRVRRKLAGWDNEFLFQCLMAKPAT